MFQITGTFDICGWKTRELDLTPALGVALIVAVILLVARTTWVA